MQPYGNYKEHRGVYKEYTVSSELLEPSTQIKMFFFDTLYLQNTTLSK